jgi:predicted alpha/beta hydrolase family esterase
MKRTIFIFHGTAGSPEGNWFPWMKEKLESEGHQVIVPRFPTPEGESLEAWFYVLEAYKNDITENTIFIGHSKGGLFTLRVLEQLIHPVYATFFVSASIGVKPILYYNEDAMFSKGFDFDWEKIKLNSQKFIVYHSDNDPYVCLDNGKILASTLGVDIQFIPNAGHLNAKSGYTKFPRLLMDVEAVL